MICRLPSCCLPSGHRLRRLSEAPPPLPLTATVAVSVSVGAPRRAPRQPHDSRRPASDHYSLGAGCRESRCRRNPSLPFGAFRASVAGSCALDVRASEGSDLSCKTGIRFIIVPIRRHSCGARTGLGHCSRAAPASLWRFSLARPAWALPGRCSCAARAQRS